MATHSSILAWRIQWTEEPGKLTVHGVTKSPTRLTDFAFTVCPALARQPRTLTFKTNQLFPSPKDNGL